MNTFSWYLSSIDSSLKSRTKYSIPSLRSFTSVTTIATSFYMQYNDFNGTKLLNFSETASISDGRDWIVEISKWSRLSLYSMEISFLVDGIKPLATPSPFTALAIILNSFVTFSDAADPPKEGISSRSLSKNSPEDESLFNPPGCVSSIVIELSLLSLTISDLLQTIAAPSYLFLKSRWDYSWNDEYLSRDYILSY